jgi:hypothetical protein
VLVRIVPIVLSALLFFSPTVARAQSFELHGAGGRTITDPGHSLTAGFGFSPTSRLTFMVDLERTHIPSQFHTDERGFMTATRGGTLTVAVPALRVSLFGRERLGPYVLAGFAAGLSRPNVNDTFPTPVTHEVRGPFFGGGVQVPIGDRVALFADVRMMLVVGREGDELFAVAPIRGGIAWRF